ncbi:MAG TPA: hypothetical protein VHJ38_18420 [Nitrososphaeraceae archaeon]|jgi:hypothetical protein|nr:hypothetical protein [Nitrososphaeraceae archaeon]HSE99676.1 hypothetical protein [Nitrososphaeraceae archaeon]
MKYKYLAMVLLLISSFLSLSYPSFFPSVLVFGESKVMISPHCGSEEGFSININANHFSPNSHVSWVIFDSNIDPKFNGYFATNSTGGFKEVTYVDHLLSGEYSIFFFDDSDINYMYDNEQNIYRTSLTIPCSNK